MYTGLALWYDEGTTTNDHEESIMRDVRVTYRGREITSKAGRALTLALLSVAFMLIIMLAILSLPLHPVLRAMGRQGFMYHDGRGGVHYNVSKQGFTKVR